MKSLTLRPRLLAAAHMLLPLSMADIGCDHGKLCAYLLQNGAVPRAIGVDLSAASIEKAAQLRARCALDAGRFPLRQGDGLFALAEGEAEQLCFCGMGGELIAALLCARPEIAGTLSRIVMQPMGGAAELRAFLHANRYRIEDEALVMDAGRIYQLIAAAPGEAEAFSRHFPKGCFVLGPRLFEKRDPLLLPFLLARKRSHEARLARALQKGQRPAELTRILAETESLIQLAKGELPL